MLAAQLCWDPKSALKLLYYFKQSLCSLILSHLFENTHLLVSTSEWIPNVIRIMDKFFNWGHEALCGPSLACLSNFVSHNGLLQFLSSCNWQSKTFSLLVPKAKSYAYYPFLTPSNGVLCCTMPPCHWGTVGEVSLGPPRLSPIWVEPDCTAVRTCPGSGTKLDSG